MEFSTQASIFADKIMSCNTMEDLFCVRQEIQTYFDLNPQFKKDWKEWLLDIKESKIFCLKPDKPLNEIYSKEGLKNL